MDPAAINAAIQPYDASQYLQTAHTANRVSKQVKILGSSNIMLGGKVIIHPQAVIRGDLVRTIRPASGQAESKGVDRIVVNTGRYCVIGEAVVLRPPWRVYKGVFSYYPSKMGDYVHIGANSIVESLQLGSYIDIGRDCVIGRSAIIKDCVRLLDGSVVPPNASIPAGQLWGGNPAQRIADLPESWAEMHEDRCRDYYARFRPASVVGRKE